MKNYKKINIYLCILFLLLETFFEYITFTQTNVKDELLKAQGILNNGINITIIITIVSVITTTFLFLLQYAIARILIKMFSQYVTNIFYYILPRNIALIINIIFLFILCGNQQIIFSVIILMSSLITIILFYKKNNSIVYSFIFAMPIFIDSTINILMELK